MSVNSVRSLVRPVVTLLLVLAVLIFVGIDKAIPDRLWDIVLVVIGFWFGSRIKETPPIPH